MKCRICEEPLILSSLKAKGARQAFGCFFEYQICSVCSSLSLKNIPNNLGEFYKNYYSFQDFSNELMFSKFKKLILKTSFSRYCPRFLKKILIQIFCAQENDFKLTSLIPLCPQKEWRILDVGSGSGDFVHHLHSLKFKNAIGIDPFLEKNIHYPNGASIFKKELESVDERFDLISFHHSFEHMENPKQCMEKVKKILNPGGVCLIRLPNIECWSFKIFKEFWVGIHAPYHIFLPSYEGLKKLLKPLNLKIQACFGEQVIDFFLISMENFMGIPDFHEQAVRSLTSKKKNLLNKTPWHCKKTLAYWRSMKKFVIRKNLCDCVSYHITHDFL